MITISDVCSYYLESLRCKRPESVRSQLKRAEAELGSMPAEKLKGYHLSRYRASRRKQGRADSTINRELGYLRAALRRAIDDELIARMPKFKLPREDNARSDLLTAAEVKAVASYAPAVVSAIIRFAFATGWRKAAILGLKWNHIERGDPGFIHLPIELSKSKKSVLFPIVGEVNKILEEREGFRKTAGWQSPLVFHRSGEPVKDFYKAFYKAQDLAGIEPAVVFHSLRRSMVSHYRQQANISESTILSLAGMRTRSILDRYTIERGDTLISAVVKASAIGG